MKAIKYLVAGALMLSISAPTMAQDTKSQIDAITKVVVDNKGDVKATQDAVKQYLKLYKKDAVALAGLGQAFLDAKNFEEAKKYAALARKANKNVADGYLLEGNIAAAQDDGGEAASWYEQATIFDPQNPNGYVRYASIYQKVDPDGAVAMLEKLRTVKPDYPVDGAAGYMYSKNDKLKSAISYYDKVQNVTSLEDYILFDYASTAYVLDQYDKALKLSVAGIQKYPDYSPFKRMAFYASDKLKNYSDAVSYADQLFNKTDTLKFIANDYMFYADALMNLGRTSDAISAYNKLKEVDPSRTDVSKLVSDVYAKQKDYANAVTAYKQYLADNSDKLTYKDLDGLADIFIDQASADDASQAVKVKAFEEADKVYAEMGEKFDYAAEYAIWKRALMNHSINPDVKEGRALPYYTKYISMIEPKAEKKQSELNKLATAYTYLAVHYIQNDKKTEAKTWAAKLLEIRPDDANGQQIMSIK